MIGGRRLRWVAAGSALVAASVGALDSSTTPTIAAAAASPLVAAGTVCLVDNGPADLDRLFDTEPGGVVGADYQRALALPDGRVLWTFQDAAVRLGPDDITIVHNIAVVQDRSCFTVLRTGTRADPRPAFFASRTEPYARWFWPLDSAVDTDGRIHVFAAEMEERGTEYLTHTVPVGTWTAILDPATLTVVDERRPPNASADLYGWSIASDDEWTYLYAHCYRQFGFDEYSFVAAFDRSCAAEVTVGRVPVGRLSDVPQYWNGATWQADPRRAAPIIETRSRRINADQFEWTGARFVSVNKEGDWWGDTIILSESRSPTGPFAVYDVIAAPVKCADCNSFFATWVPARAVDRADRSFVIALSHNRWDGVITSLYRPTFHRVGAPRHVPARWVFELDVGSDVGAAAINVTTVDPSTAGHVTAYPCATGLPLASNLNHAIEPVVANLVLARPDDTGRVCLYSHAETDLVVDLAGTFPDASGFVPVERPVRLVDTREGLGGSRLLAGAELRVTVPGGPDSAVALNIAAVLPAGDGHLTVHPCDRPRPATSNVNYGLEPVVSNLVVVEPGADGTVCIASHAATDLVVDLAGAFDRGFVALDPAVRLADTRVDSPVGRVGAGGVLDVVVPTPPGSAAVTAAVLNVAAVLPSAPGFLTVYPCDVSRPLASNVNHSVRPVVSNLVVSRVGGDGRVCVYTSAGADVVVDLLGTLGPDAGYAPLAAPTRLVDTRRGTGVPGQLGLR